MTYPPPRDPYSSRRREAASGYAGSSVARRQTAYDAIQQVMRGNVSPSRFEAEDLFAPEQPEEPSGGGGLLGSIMRFGQDRLEDVIIGTSAMHGGTGSPMNVNAALLPLDSAYQQYRPEALPGGGTKSLSKLDTTYGLTQRDIDIMASRYGSGFSAERQQARQAGSDSILNAYQRFQAEQQAALDSQLGDIRDQYTDRISQLEEELRGYRGGLAGVNKAYADYADDADAILSEAAAVEAEALPEGDIGKAVVASYDQFEGALGEVFAKMDANNNQALSAEMSQQIRTMQDVMVDALRVDGANIRDMHELASANAQALAHMAWKDDLYNAEKSRFETELQIQAAIQSKADQLEQAKSEMNKALQRSRDAFEGQTLDPSELWDYALNDYLSKYGLNELEAGQLRALWDTIGKNNPEAIANFSAFKGEIMLDVNRTNLQRAGLWSQVEGLLGSGVLTEAQQGTFVDALTSTDIVGTFGAKGAFGGTLSWLNALVPIDKLQSVENPVSIKDANYSAALDLWSHWQDFTQNYEKYTSAPTVPAESLAWAPDNSYVYPIAGTNWWSGGGFGSAKSSGRTHEGVDIHAPFGSPVVATVTGEVVSAGWTSDMGGWTVTVRDPRTGYTYYYAHLDQKPPVNKGDQVRMGSTIGVVGDSGNASGGPPHLHFGVRDRNGTAVNPSSALKATNGANGTKSPGNIRTLRYPGYA